MAKKYIFLLLSFFSICYTYAENPVINNVVVENGKILAYGSGFSNYTTYEATCGGTGLVFDRLPSDTQIIFYDKIDINNCSFQLNFKKLDSFSGTFISYQSNTVLLEKKMTTYISSVALNNTGFGYFIRIKTNEKLNTTPKVVINNLDISSNNVILDQDSIVVTNFDFSKTNIANVYIKIGDKTSNTVSLDLDNKLSFGLDKIEKFGKSLKVYFSTNTNGYKMYLDGNQYTSGTGIFTIEPSSVVVTFPDSTKSVYDVYFTNGTLRSKNVKLDLSNYFYPYIERLELNEGNSSGAVNMLYGKNFSEDDPAKIKIYINGKQFNVYGGETTPEKPNTLFNFAKMQELRYTFSQSGQYLIGEQNTLQLEINGRKSNILYFTPGDKNKKDTYYSTGNLSSNLKIKLIPNFATGSNYVNNEFKVGTISLLSGDKSTFFIKDIKFELNLKEKVDFLPINYIKLGNNYGIINKVSDLKYEVTFENYSLENLDSQSYDLNVKFSDNLNSLQFELLPKQMTYQFLSYIDDTKYNDKKLDIITDSSLYINGTIISSNCMDSSYDYKYCKNYGFVDKSKLFYGVSSGQSLNSVIDSKPQSNSGTVVANTVVNSGSVIVFTGSTSNNISSSSNTTLQSDIILSKLDTFVQSKYKSDEVSRKKLYKLLYSKIYEIYKSTQNTQKKLLLKSVLLGIKSKYSK